MDELIFAGNKYISSKRAGKLTGYTTDYIGQMCRGAKMECRLVGRNWYISEKAVREQKKSFKKAQLNEDNRAIEYKKIELEPMYYSNDDRSNNINLNKKPIVDEEKELVLPSQDIGENVVEIKSKESIVEDIPTDIQEHKKDVISVLHMIDSPVVDLRETKQENTPKQTIEKEQLLPQKSHIKLPMVKIAAATLALAVLLFIVSTFTLQQSIQYASSEDSISTEYQLAGVGSVLDF